MNSSVHLPEVIQWMRLLAGPLVDLNFQGKREKIICKSNKNETIMFSFNLTN